MNLDHPFVNYVFQKMTTDIKILTEHVTISVLNNLLLTNDKLAGTINPYLPITILVQRSDL